eukprot:12308076-Karenia_brevis.AAC.1
MEVDEHHQSLYMSLLGGVAWPVLTRLDLAVYVQGLQRHTHTPCVWDCRRLRAVAHQAKHRESGLWYRQWRGGS